MNKVLLHPNLHLILLTGISISIPLPRLVGNIFIIVSFAISLYVFKKNKKGLKDLLDASFIFPAVFYTYILLNGLYGYNSNEFLRQIDKNFLALIIPFSLLTLLKPFFFDKIKKTYSYALVLITLSLILINIINLLSGGPSSMYYFHDFTEFVGINAVYFSLFLSLGILICLNQVYKRIDIKINLIFLLTFALGLLFCASKAIIAATIIVSLIHEIFSKKSKKTLLFIISIGTIFTFIIYSNPYLKERFVEGVKYDLIFETSDELANAKEFSNSEIDNISDLELRAIFLKISIYHLVNDGNLLFGYGVSDYQDYLDYYYMVYGLAPFHYEGYSPHNQYAYSLVSSGIIGLLILVLYLVYSFFQNFKYNNLLGLCFLILICIAMLFETYLLRTKGIIFFFFFNTYFLLDNKQHENSNFRNKGYT
ncbi:O-antigen ligase family protein [Psychroflexus tropicus]|uniref:O-antigen ligase family protein n=1 Tax=Psychroflexus tropicus TaxID=197345 RepID=UPI0003769B61|nr:O-antigen ligase family protein [Psychroflexus tropicus]